MSSISTLIARLTRPSVPPRNKLTPRLLEYTLTPQKFRVFRGLLSPAMILLLHSPPDSHRNNVSARCLTILTIYAFALMLGTPAFSQNSALTLPRHLGELVGESQIVLQGNVTSVTL